MTFTITDSENKQIIKKFFTVFNFIKAIRYNDNEAIVLFKTGNGTNFHDMEILEKIYY